MSDSENSANEQRSRGRSLARVVAAVITVVAIYAVTGFLVVPRVVRWAIRDKGSQALHRTVTLGEVRFNPFTFEGHLRDLAIRDRDGQPLASFRHLKLRFVPFGIFRRAWRLRELTIEQPVVHVHVLGNGRLSIADLFESEDKSSPKRLIIDALAIRGGRLDYTDDSSAPRFSTSFTPLNADVHDLITIPGERGEHALSIGFDRDSTIRIAGRQTLEPLGFSGTIAIKNLHLATVAEKFGLNSPLLIRDGQTDIAIQYELTRQSKGIQFRVTRGQMTATNLAVASNHDPQLLTVPKIEVREATMAFPERQVRIGSVRIIEPKSTVAWDPQGKFNWPSSDKTPPKPQTPQPPQTAAWKITVAKAGIEQGTLHFEDQQPASPVRFDLTSLAISATELSNDTSVPVRISASAQSGSGSIALNGSLVPSPFSLETTASLSAVDLAPFRPYAAQVPGLTLGGGSLGFDGRMLFSGSQPYLIDGSGAFRQLEFLDSSNNRLLGCRIATVRQIHLDGAASRFRIRSLDLDGLYANVVIDKQRNLNLSAIGATSTPPPASTPPAKKGSFDIGTVNITDGTIDYRDDSLVLPFATAIRSTKGRITDVSTTSAAAGTIRLDGIVAENGTMKAEGTMRMSDPFGGTDLFVQFRNVPMPTLTPYSAEFAGYAIDRGALDLDLHYRIANRRLNGDHRVVASDLTLGRKVSGTKAGFAVRLAVALLKDHDGKINLEVPIEGTVDSPEFNYRAVLWQAVKTILLNIVKAPFRALGHAMGIGGENLQVVTFAPGEAVVTAPEVEKLRKIAGELARRGELNLEIEGRFDPQIDAAAMRKARLEAKLASRRDAAAAGASSLESILESLYVEAYSPERLAETRAKFTATPPPPPPEPKKKLWQRKTEPQAAPPAVFDASGFYDALRTDLVAAQTITPDDLHTLGRARAAAIAAALTDGSLLSASRVVVRDPREGAMKPGAQQIDIEMKLAAKGASPDETDQ